VADSLRAGNESARRQQERKPGEKTQFLPMLRGQKAPLHGEACFAWLGCKCSAWAESYPQGGDKPRREPGWRENGRPACRD